MKVLYNKVRDLLKFRIVLEDQKMLIAQSVLHNILNKKEYTNLTDLEMKVFSQWGDDGIIQWLIHNLEIPNKTFIEFGVQDYRESNTRFLLMNNNWSGMIADGSHKFISNIKNSEYYWKYDLLAQYAFVDADNVNDLLDKAGFDLELGLLHIDIDGVDYWILEKVKYKPVILIMEYNSTFGKDRAITVPYRNDFDRTKAHFSNLYHGASVKALCHLASKKGYSFIGCDSAGNNAFFIRNDKLKPNIRVISPEEGYVASKSRESRDKEGKLSYLSFNERVEILRGMPVYNVIEEKLEKF